MKKDFLAEQTFTQGAVVLLVSTILVKLIGAFFKIPLSSDYCLGDLGFGYFSSVYDIYVPIYTLAISGFPVAISKIISDYTAKNNDRKIENALKIFKRLLFFIGVIGFVLILLSIKPFVMVTDKSGKTAYSMFAMAPAMLFCCLSSVYRGAFEGYRNMVPTAISNIIEAFSKVLLGFSGAFITVKITDNSGLGAAAAMFGITLGTVISYLYLKITFYRNYKTCKTSKYIQLADSDGILKSMFLVCLAIVFSSLACSVVSLIDAVSVKWIMSSMVKNNANVLIENISNYFTLLPENENIPTFLYGFRSKTYTLFYLVPTFTTALSISALPMISASRTSENYNKANQDIITLIKFSSIISFPVAFGLIFVGSPIMSLIYGDTTAFAGGKMLVIFGFAAAFAGLSMAIATVLQGIGKQAIVFINFAIGLALKVLFNLLFVSNPKLNIFGSALSTLLCFAYIFISLIINFKKSENMPKIISAIFKPLIAGLFCGITAYLVTTISSNKLITLLAIFIAGIVYFTLILALRTLNKNDFAGFSFGNKIVKILNLSD